MMKRISVLLTLFLIGLVAVGQISVNGGTKSNLKEFSGIDYLVVFNGIDNNSSIQYTGTSNAVKWYKFQETNSAISNQAENYNVEDATGYILEVDGEVAFIIYVMDYKNYLPVFNSLRPSITQDNECEGIALTLDATIPPISYQTTDGIFHAIDRDFKLTYETKEWDTSWTDKTIEKEITLPLDILNLYANEAPLCDTRFKIEGDQFASLLGIELPKIESDFYNAQAVECHITNVTNTRNELNEDQRPSTANTLEGSAPLEVLFKSNANIPVAEFYRWEIFKNNQLLFIRNDQDQRYTFSESGTYTVKLTASNGKCEYVDSVSVKLSESELQVPSVFTPNGDNINDEFRVAYRSLASFKAWVFNRWGRKVYSWSDPQKGWDGRINGHDAAPGGYIYLIEAVGTDGKEYKMKGVVNLLRGNPAR